jgi:hypothetical protein
MRGYWKDKIMGKRAGAGTTINPNDNRPHFTDEYKTPYHTKFSNESKYATPDAPRWIDDHRLVDKNGRLIVDESKEK